VGEKTILLALSLFFSFSLSRFFIRIAFFADGVKKSATALNCRKKKMQPLRVRFLLFFLLIGQKMNAHRAHSHEKCVTVVLLDNNFTFNETPEIQVQCQH